MRRLLCVLLLTCFSCTACVHLPGEEYAFAVALGVDYGDDGWQAAARIPDYQQEGSYVTLRAQADTLPQALMALEAAVPMRLHLGQARLIVMGESLCRASALPDVLDALMSRRDLRPDAQLAVADAPVNTLLDALSPRTGVRLSKSLDVLLETRAAQGVIPSMSVRDALLQGRRQAAVLPRVRLDGETFDLSGAMLFDADRVLVGALTPPQTQLLALLRGQMKKGRLTLGETVVDVVAFSSQLRVSTGEIRCEVHLRCAPSAVPDEQLAALLTTALDLLVRTLAQNRCDAFGLLRSALPVEDAAQAAEALATLPWRFEVTVTRGA